MLIKIIRFKRKTPRSTTHLRRLLKYLLSPKRIESTGGRLMGPPQFDHLAVTKTPWGDVLEQFVTEIVEQFDFYVREAGVCQRTCAKASLSCEGVGRCIGRDKPTDWYVHIIFSFAPQDKDALRSPPDPHSIPAKWASSSSNLIRVARDALDFLGWDKVQPAVFVAHSDKDHPHVHAVISTAVFPDAYWDVFNFQRIQILEISNIASDAFHLTKILLKPSSYHTKWECLSRGNSAGRQKRTPAARGKSRNRPEKKDE